MVVDQSGRPCASTGQFAARAITAQCMQAVFLFVTFGVLALRPATAHAAPDTSDSDATSSRGARDEAIRAIPWQVIAPDQRQRAQFVIQNCSIYRKLPTRIID